MTLKDGEQTKQRILQKAEELFFENGYHATSVESIAKAAGVNKALIYYYFDAKSDLMTALVKNMMQDLAKHLADMPKNEGASKPDAARKEKIQAEVKYLQQHRRVLAIMMMEAFKGKGQGNFLFQCAEMVMSHEHKGQLWGNESAERPGTGKYNLHLVHEFYTGLMPMISFVVMQDHWCEYFHCDAVQALELFMEAFVRSHLQSHVM